MSKTTLQGIAASEGIAIGPVYYYSPPELAVQSAHTDHPEQEKQRFAEACHQAGEEIAVLRDRVRERAGDESAAIFDAHMMILSDPTLIEKVHTRIEAGGSAEASVVAATDELAAVFEEIEDEMFAARAADVRDLGRRLLRILLGVEDTSLDVLQQPAIILAHDLTPSDTASLDPGLTLGLCTAVGGLTSHTAILARTLGIPAVVGIGMESVERLAAADTIILNGSEGTVMVDPSSSEMDEYRRAAEVQAARFSELQGFAQAEAHTADGKRIEVAANIGDLESAHTALELGAEGIGLLRTEFLYLNESRPPSEEKQFEIYRAIFEQMGQLPVIVRTLDIGGDKPASYIPFDTELNPFLGWRAIRISLDDTALFKTQLRAILRAAHGHNALIMFPMISQVEELRSARQLLDESRAELDASGLPYADDVQVGIMVETPAAVWMADRLAEECDFFSIGTNDLTQYTLAVDRTNERIASLFQPLHPAVLRSIKTTIDAAHPRGKWVGMCGELAGMKKAIPILLGLGLDEFSMVPRAIPEAKWLLSRMSVEQARAIADHALNLAAASEVEAYMEEQLKQLEG